MSDKTSERAPTGRTALRCVALNDTEYVLTVYPAITDSTDREYLGYRFGKRGEPALFEGEDFGCSPMHASDSDETLRALLGFLTLRPGDTDADHFAAYTDDQRAFCASDAEELSMWAIDDDPIGSFEDLPVKVRRVQLHPGLDDWMRGDRYGEIVKEGRGRVWVKLDKSGKTKRYPADMVTDLLPPGHRPVIGALATTRGAIARRADTTERAIMTLKADIAAAIVDANAHVRGFLQACEKHGAVYTRCELVSGRDAQLNSYVLEFATIVVDDNGKPHWRLFWPDFRYVNGADDQHNAKIHAAMLKHLGFSIDKRGFTWRGLNSSPYVETIDHLYRISGLVPKGASSSNHAQSAFREERMSQR